MKGKIKIKVWDEFGKPVCVFKDQDSKKLRKSMKELFDKFD